MTTLPFTDARNRLSELVDEVERTHERVVITRHGHAAAVLIAPDDLESMEETISVLNSSEAMRQLMASRDDVEVGDVYEAAELAAFMKQRRGSWRSA